jgi:hypothetical protein
VSTTSNDIGVKFGSLSLGEVIETPIELYADRFDSGANYLGQRLERFLERLLGRRVQRLFRQ